jgi:uncharacterized membrane protein
MSIWEILTGLPAQYFADGKVVFLGGLLTLVAISLLGLAAWLAYRRVRARLTLGRWRTLIGLRLALSLLLGLMLGIPVLRLINQRDDLYLAVLVDTSRSMSIADAGQAGVETRRIDAVRSLLSGDAGLLASLGKTVRPIIYGFDDRLQRLSGPDALSAEGRSTNLFRAVRDLDADLRGLPVAATLLISDGCRNAGGPENEVANLLKERGLPLYAIGVGSTTQPLDIEVLRVEAPKIVRRNTEVLARVAVRHTGWNTPFPLQILRGDIALATITVEPHGDGDLELVTVPFTPDSEGAQTYSAVVAPVEGERIPDNNRRDFTIELNDDRLPVLYVEGSPRTEFRFMRQALYRDRDFRVVSILRLGKGNFYVQGAADGEGYLEQGFPTTREQLFSYQAVIIGSIEASYFSADQLAMLDEFVRVRGGGLIMLGGSSSFGAGGYSATPLGKALPFAISPKDGPYRPGTYALRLSEAGREHPLLRLTADASRSRQLWDLAPPLIGRTPTGELRLSAQQLITSDDNSVVLAAHSYGAGRVAAFTSSGSWYWQMNLPSDVGFHEKFWKQALRWLAVGARERLTVDVQSELFARGTPVTIHATVLAKDLQPINDARVLCTITNAAGTAEDLDMEWILREDGVYECSYIPAEDGDYRVSVRLEGDEEHIVRSVFSITEPIAEFNDTTLKAERLRTLAEATGGTYAAASDAATELTPLLKRVCEAVSVKGVEPTDRPLWNMPLLLVLLVLLAAAEWSLRRRWGLA